MTFVYPDHYIVASFNLWKPVSLLEDNILQLENDIFDEIVAPSIKVSALFFSDQSLSLHLFYILI